MALLERDEVLVRLASLLDSAREGRGRVALIRGEAGIGKTSVVRAFTESAADGAFVLWGACDDLLVARPLGPVWDMAFDEPALMAALRSDERYEAFRVLQELFTRSLRPTVAVIEDVHWADEASLDVIKFLGRRIGSTHSLLVLTLRDLPAPDHPLQVTLGDLPVGEVESLLLEPLSLGAVESLVDDTDNAREIWRVSGGNPLFVSELVHGQGDDVPPSVRDVMRARVARLADPARRLVEVASVAPSRLELTIAQGMVVGFEVGLEEAIAQGILHVDDDSLAFRHELARLAVEGDLSEPRRRELNLKVMHAYEAVGDDLSRMAHHARAADDGEAMVRILPSAARAASDAGSHKETVSHLRALEPFVDRLSPEERADHYDVWAQEEYLSAGGDLEISQQAIELRRALGNQRRLGESILAAAIVAHAKNERAIATRLVNEAVSVLEPVGGESLAEAYSEVARLAMLAFENDRALEFAEKALALAQGQERARAHALNTVGTVRAFAHYPEGMEMLEESFRLSDGLGSIFDQSRASVNAAQAASEWRDLAEAEKWIQTNLEVTERLEVSSFIAHMRGLAAEIDLHKGNWEEAMAGARSVTEARAAENSRTQAAKVLARAMVRAGHDEAPAAMTAAWQLAESSGEFQHLGPAASIVAEYLWVTGSTDQDATRNHLTLLEALKPLGVPWTVGDLAIWLWLDGQLETIPGEAPEPILMLGRGEWRMSADWFGDRGVPYEQSIALSLGDAEARLEALSILDDLGAEPLASKIRGQLREEGVKGVPRGAAPTTRESSLGLTKRQTEVLELLAEGLSNAQIAERLFISVRTVEAHVAGILARLNVSTREEAVLRADIGAKRP